MHQKLKIQLVAMLATMTGTALGTCHAMQTNASPTQEVDSGVVQQADPPYQGAFGAVKIARPVEPPTNNGDFPPIVSPDEFAKHPADEPMVLPPIVKPFEAAQLQSTKVEAKKESRPLPEYVAANPATSGNDFNGLKPMSPMATNATSEVATADPESSTASAPAPVIQADTTPVVSSGDATVDKAFQWNAPKTPAQAVSAAGIPLYPGASPTSYTAPENELPPIVQGSDATTSVFVPNQSTGSDIQTPFGQSAVTPMTQPGQGSPYIDPSSQVVFPGNALQAKPPIQSDVTPIVMPNSPIRQTSAPMSPSRNMLSSPTRTVGTQGSTFMAPGMAGQEPNYFSAPPSEAPVISSPMGAAVCDGCGGRGCPECGSSGAVPGDVAGCQSCGPDGCFNGGDVSDSFQNSGSFANARRYIIFDAMYLDRYDGTIAVSNFGGLNDFEDDLIGARVTFGRREDCANGDEFSYFGSGKLSQSSVVSDAEGRITVGFPNTGPFATETTAFRNATEQAQYKQTTFQSIEYNRNDWGWDVMRTFWGVRYIYVQDDYSISSRNLDDETGLFELTTFNNLLGPQLGYEFFWDVGYRLSWSTATKFGFFANPNQVNTSLFNAGAQFLDLKDNNTSFAGCIDFNFSGHFKLTEHTRFRFGYNGLYLGNVAGVSDNVPTTITPTTGSDTSDSGEMYFQGINFGFEIYK